MTRVSPAMLILLHRTTGKLYCEYCASLHPFEKARFAVDWAGESESKNWMHIAREYTEKWLHQQQIRDAVNNQALLTREFYYPSINIFMFALPYTYRNIKAEEGTIVQLTISSSIGGEWYIKMQEGQWQLVNKIDVVPQAEVIMDADTSWKLFSKSLRPGNVKNKIVIKGNQKLGEVALNMVSVMA